MSFAITEITQAVVQGTPEWFAQRLGKVTASRVEDVIAKTKSGYSTSRKNYCVELALQRITGNVEEGFTNAAMQWGTDKEPDARTLYEMRTGNIVEECAMIQHPTIAMAGASPDGLLYNNPDGQLEIKCPQSATHLDTLVSKKPQGKYITQMQWQMACTGRKFCDFVSYDPRFPEKLRLFVTRVYRDDAFIATLEAEVISFLKEVDAMVDEMKKLEAE